MITLNLSKFIQEYSIIINTELRQKNPSTSPNKYRRLNEVHIHVLNSYIIPILNLKVALIFLNLLEQTPTVWSPNQFQTICNQKTILVLNFGLSYLKTTFGLTIMVPTTQDGGLNSYWTPLSCPVDTIYYSEISEGKKASNVFGNASTKK